MRLTKGVPTALMFIDEPGCLVDDPQATITFQVTIRTTFIDLFRKAVGGCSFFYEHMFICLVSKNSRISLLSPRGTLGSSSDEGKDAPALVLAHFFDVFFGPFAKIGADSFSASPLAWKFQARAELHGWSAFCFGPFRFLVVCTKGRPSNERQVRGILLGAVAAEDRRVLEQADRVFSGRCLLNDANPLYASLMARDKPILMQFMAEVFDDVSVHFATKFVHIHLEASEHVSQGPRTSQLYLRQANMATVWPRVRQGISSLESAKIAVIKELIKAIHHQTEV
jgi:hypothetical protein